MNLRRELRTDRRLWLACGLLAFVLLGSIHLFNEGVESKIGPSHLWGTLQTTFDHRDHAEALPIAVLAVLFVAVPSAVLGWVAQAVIVVIRDAAARNRTPDRPAPVTRAEARGYRDEAG